MNFINDCTSGLSMQIINVLRDNGNDLAVTFQLCHQIMRNVGVNSATIQFLSIELIEYIWIILQTFFTQKILRRKCFKLDIVLIIQAVFTAEIRNATFG